MSEMLRRTIKFREKHPMYSHPECPVCKEMSRRTDESDNPRTNTCHVCPLEYNLVKEISEFISCGSIAYNINHDTEYKEEAVYVLEELALCCEMEGD